MSKTILLSPSQLNEILGDNVSYLDSIDNDVPEYSGHNEVFANSPKGDNITGKDVSNDMGSGDLQKAVKRNYVVAETYTKQEFEDEILKETNRALDGQNITAMENLPFGQHKFTGDENAMAVRQNYLQNHGQEKSANVIGNMLNARRGAVELGKEIRKKAGFNNQYQRPGYKKESGNGMAHSPKLSTKSNNYLGL